MKVYAYQSNQIDLYSAKKIRELKELLAKLDKIDAR